MITIQYWQMIVTTSGVTVGVALGCSGIAIAKRLWNRKGKHAK